MKLFSRLGGYTLNTIATFAVGVLSVPAIIHFAGSASWASIAVAQAVAGVAQVAAALGWNAIGPSLIAGMDHRSRFAHYAQSLIVRGVLFLVVLPIGMFVTTLLVHSDPLAAAIAMAAYLLQSLGASWFFVGEGRPYRLLLVDTGPRLAAVLLGILALALGADILVFSIVLLVGTLTAAVLGAAYALRGIRAAKVDLSLAQLRQVAWMQRHGVATTGSAALYANMPIIAVTLFVPAALEAFTLAYKLYNYAATALQPAVQFMQSWVPGGGRDQVVGRARRAAIASVIGGLIGGVLMLLFAAPVATVLSAGQISLTWQAAAPFAVAIGAVAVSQVVGLACLTAVGRTGAVALSTAIGAVLGIALVFATAASGDAIWVAWSVAATEMFVAAFQLVVLRRVVTATGGNSEEGTAGSAT